jgi:hypothetical protein
LGDFGRCASQIVLRFVTTLSAGNTSCASRYAPNRLVDTFAVRAADIPIESLPERTAVVAADTVADVAARWWDMLGSTGVGLRGGTFATAGLNQVAFRLDAVRWVQDVAVSGTIRWTRTKGRIQAEVSVNGSGGLAGTLSMSWNDWGRRPMARVEGTLGGQAVSYSFLAP